MVHIVHNHGLDPMCVEYRSDDGLLTGACLKPQGDKKMKYNHIPVQVDAMKLTKENAAELAAWCSGRVVEEHKASDPTDVSVAVEFMTFDGMKRVQEGEYLMKAESGSWHRHNAGFFESMFKPAPRQVDLPHSHIPGARKI